MGMASNAVKLIDKTAPERAYSVINAKLLEGPPPFVCPP